MDIDFEKMREDGFFQMIQKERESDIDKVEMYGGWKKVEKCPICNIKTQVSALYETKETNSYICPICDCLFNDTIPKKPNTGWYNIKSIEELMKLPEEQKMDYRKQRFGLERINLIGKYLNKNMKESSLLDVGCGTGFFIDVANNFFKIVDGIEDSEMCLKVLKERFTNDVYKSFSETTKAYDVITMFDLFEHVLNPMGLLDVALEHLKGDGLILIYTPNHRSLAFNILGTDNNLFFPSDHLFFCSPKTIKYIANKKNLSLVMYQTAGMDMFDILAYDRDIRGVNVKNSEVFKHINQIQSVINDGMFANHMRFILRRK